MREPAPTAARSSTVVCSGRLSWPWDSVEGMCGRYAASASADDLMEEFDIDEILGNLPEPDYNVAPTVAVPAVLERISKSDQSRPAAAQPAHLGSGAVVGEGHQDRREDDQRPGRVGGREAGLPQGVQRAPVPAAGRRLLRVVQPGGGRAALGRPEPASGQEAAVLHPPRRRWAAGDGRPVRDLAGPGQGSRRRHRLAADLHGDHHRGHRRRRAHPRPDADDHPRASPTTPGSIRS